jgi:hypothetical protein
MYSDNAVNGAPFTVDRGGTFPFFRPRSVHAWDGKLNEATLSRYEKNGATVERMAYRFDYRVDRHFEAVAGKSSRVEFKHNLVLQRGLLVANHAVAYLVWDDGSISTSINGIPCTSTVLLGRMRVLHRLEHDDGGAVAGASRRVASERADG